MFSQLNKIDGRRRDNCTKQYVLSRDSKVIIAKTVVFSLNIIVLLVGYHRMLKAKEHPFHFGPLIQLTMHPLSYTKSNVFLIQLHMHAKGKIMMAGN